MITIENAYNEINTNKTILFHYITETFSNSFDKVFTNITKYERFIMDIMSYHCMDLYPEMFLKCYVTSEDYEGLNGNIYKWYIMMLNGNFDRLLKEEEITDIDIYKDKSKSIDVNRKTIYEKRYKLAKQLFEKTSIYFMKGDIDIKDIMWFIINFVTPNK